MSKIGVHVVQGSRNGYGGFVSSKPAVVLAINEGGALEEAWAESDGHTYTIFRDMKVYKEAPGDINNPPGTYAQMASYWYPQLKQIWDLNPADFYTITNEQGGNDPQSYRNLVAYEREIMKLANADGYKVCVLNLASGSPGNLDMWTEICLPFILEAGEKGNIYGRHVYGGDLVNQFGEILSGAPLRPVQEMEILEGNEYASGVVLTEVGIDGGYGYAGDRLVAQLTLYEQGLENQGLLIGICGWTLGDNSHNANFENSLPELTMYNLANPTPRWMPPNINDPPPSESLEEHIWNVSIEQQVMSLNPDAALQRVIFADGYVPVMSEFWTRYNNKEYALQAAEHLQTGDRVVYTAEVPLWDAVFKIREPLDLPPEPTKFDMGKYFLPESGEFGPIYIMKNSWGGGDERVQLQRDGMFSFVVKNSQWEKRLIGEDFINLVMDTSPGDNEFYTVNGPWLPRFMEIGDNFTRTEDVQYFNKDNCQKIRETTWTSQLGFIEHLPVYSNTAGIQLNDVVHLAWIFNGEIEEEYWYAANIGLVRWKAKDGRESGIVELIPVGGQGNNVREKINCGQENPVVIHDIVGELSKHPTRKYKQRDLDAIDTIVIHHTVSPPDRTIESIASYHVNGRGYPGIAYHFVIKDNGKIYQTNYLKTVSAHTYGQNGHTVGVALQGDFTDKSPPQKQLDAGRNTVMYLKKQGDWGVAKHRDFVQTACPGQSWAQWFDYVAGN
jgi:hypothetical protein